ncbi:hypothetical protein C1A38_11530 [Verrucosispora sp. ts21]|uniref:hypothetical protein n=1 Tax=Verrucosispora sp. ts21 TaxID=2069341 RepID=UPI000C886B41|nr:hypothetical protein [Verrucosispora sp. ts21]PMR60888.1 hypothetical protein C1A38_11530 [Verrucosispora sp. ts21]
MSRTISKKHLLGGLAAAGVLAVGIAAPTVALADDKATPSPSASTSAEDRKGEQRPERGERHQAFAEALAEELGVPADKVTEALEKLREQHKPQGKPEGERPEGRGGNQHRGGEHKRGGDRGPQHSPEDRKEAMAERLAKAVEEGMLTQEQADAITAAVEAGVFGGPGAKGDKAGQDDTAGK